jgi:hypothetical protein
MKTQELKNYTRWIADNYRPYRAELNLWESKDGTHIVTGELPPKYYLKSKNRKAKGVFGFLARLLPFLILPILPIKPVQQDTVRIDTGRVTTVNKPLAPVAVWVIRKLPKQ